MDVLSLLRSKNKCLERFEQASLRFLSESDEAVSNAAFLAAVTRLETERNKILMALELFNRKLNESIEELSPSEKDYAFVQSARDLTQEADQIITRVGEADQRVSSRIVARQERLNQEHGSSERSRSIISKFKSSWARGTGESAVGEELDQKL